MSFLTPVMDCKTTSISYQQTGYFSKIIVDYVGKASELQAFYKYPVSLDGLKDAIESRREFNTDRKLLVEVLRKQYQGMNTAASVRNNIELLLEENTFTFVTAHQPNIFTGYLYFIYKILH